MPKLFCPSCLKPVTVPDDSAGHAVTCPACNKEFDAPAKYTPAVLTEVTPPLPLPPQPMSPPPPEPKPMATDLTTTRTAPPPGLVPPAAPPDPLSIPAPPMPAGYTRARGISFNPRVIAWLPAILLVVTFLCTFGPWVGMYVGGYAVYSQGPWSALVGKANPNYALLDKMQAPSGWESRLNSDWELILPYLLVLILATAFALADRGFHSLDPRRIPPLAGAWNYRKLAILLLAALAFALAFTHVLNGFGLERAIRGHVAEQFAKERADAKAKGDEARLALVQYRADQEIAKYNLERTTWLYLALICNLLAVLTMLAHTALERRGNKPPPRLVVQY